IVNASTQYNSGGSRLISSDVTHSNLFVGVGSGPSATTKTNNTYFGALIGTLTPTGSSNSFFGAEAGRFAKTRDDNSFFGASAGRVTTGDNNTFIGANAGEANQSGSNNTIVGQSADVGPINLTNAAAIGFRALVTQSNSVVLGSINGVNNCQAPGCDSVTVGV